jgi:predicted transposase YdaD
MSEDSIHQPHDKLFKQGFSDPANAAGFLRHQFPASLSGQIDWDHLTLQSGSFVDSHFRQHESDLLFSTRLRGSNCFLYILFEHQLIEDPLIALRLLRYMVRIWESFLKEKPGALLPVILPVVLAQSEKPWRVNPQFSSLIDLSAELAEDCRRFIPDFHFQLVQLAGMPYEAIPGTPAGILLLRVMKAERCDELLTDPVWDEGLLDQIPGVVFEMIIRYLLGADVDSTIFERRLREISQSNLRDSAMTLAQQLTQKGLEKGLQEGRQEGRQEGLREAVLETLAIRFGAIPQGIAGSIRQVEDEARLRLLHHASIQCATMDEFASRL